MAYGAGMSVSQKFSTKESVCSETAGMYVSANMLSTYLLTIKLRDRGYIQLLTRLYLCIRQTVERGDCIMCSQIRLM